MIFEDTSGNGNHGTLHGFGTRPEESAHPGLWDGLVGYWDPRHGIYWQRPRQPSLLYCLIILTLLVCHFTQEHEDE